MVAHVTVKSIGQLFILSNNFRCREMVGITHGGESVGQFFKFRFTNGNCDLLNDISVGDEVDVTFVITGREWINPGTGESNIFNTLDAERISRYEQHANQ